MSGVEVKSGGSRIREDLVDEKWRLKNEIWDLVEYVNKTYDAGVDVRDLLYFCSHRLLYDVCENRLRKIAAAELGESAWLISNSVLELTISEDPGAKARIIIEDYPYTKIYKVRFDVDVPDRIYDEALKALVEFEPEIVDVIRRTATFGIMWRLAMINWINDLLEENDDDHLWLRRDSIMKGLENIRRARV